MINLRFHRLEDEQQLRFYQMPKVLFTDKKYKGLSLGAKAMYSILRDRQELSIKNNWVDKDGYIYLIFTIENLCELLDISDRTATKYKKELAKYNLLFEKRLGQGKPNRLYILKPDYSEVDTYKKDNNIDLPEESYPQGQSIENTKTRNNYDSQNRKKYDSRNEESTTLDPKKVRCNDTEFNDTEFNDTHSFIQKQKENERLNENTNRNLEELEMILNKAEVHEIYLEDNYYPVKRAIESLYYRNVNLNINGMSIPPSKIRRDLLELNSFHIEMGIQIFKEQSRQQKITNRINYLATCIYNSIFDMELKIQNDLIYDGII